MTVATRRIAVAQPTQLGREREYVLDALERNQLSHGRYLAYFEQEFADLCDVEYAAACSSGTAALHLALLAIGVGPGDEVIVPALTFIATANAATYCGARPVIVDVEPETWCINPAAVERAITPRTKAIIAVHLYGEPADMDALDAIARPRAIPIVEDAAEAHGATYYGRPVGGIGRIGCFSFYGNKIVTTGEGGMVVTDHGDLADRIWLYRGQGMEAGHAYVHPVVGYNYRLTNLQAALGLAQVERLEDQLRARVRVMRQYRDGLPKTVQLQGTKRGAMSSYWMVAGQIDRGCGVTGSELVRRLAQRGIETRPVFPPLHHQAPYRDGQTVCPVAERLHESGIVLPTHTGLTEDDVAYVCEAIGEALG